MLILVIVSVLLTIMLSSATLASFVESKDRELVTLLAIASILSTLLALPTAYLFKDGLTKGIQADLGTGITRFLQEYGALPYDESEELYKALQDSEDINGRYVVFYRADCDDCLNELPRYSRLFNSDKVYFVCTRTEYGSRLKRKAGVHWTPSVYEIRDGKITLVGDEQESINILDNL